MAIVDLIHCSWNEVKFRNCLRPEGSETGRVQKLRSSNCCCGQNMAELALSGSETGFAGFRNNGSETISGGFRN